MSTAARACSFGAGTAVLAADGERVPIEDISPGDEVVATDPETGERVTRTVDASWSHVDQTVTISIDDRELVTTEDHRFWSQTAGAFVPAGDLEVGDKVVGDHGRVHTVTRTAEVGGYERVWNLSIDQVHTYHVGDTDTLVHNTCPTAWLLSKGPKDVFVYYGERGDERVYVGITNNISRRSAEHGSRFKVQPFMGPMTRRQARAVEQVIHERNPQFENIYNSISPKRDIYEGVRQWGEDQLDGKGAW